MLQEIINNILSNNLIFMVLIGLGIILLFRIANKLLKKITGLVLSVYSLLKILTMLGINVNIMELFK